MTKYFLVFCAAGCLALVGCVATGGSSAGSGDKDAAGAPAGSKPEVVPFIPALPGASGS